MLADQGGRLGASRRIYEHAPYMSQELQEADQELQGGYMGISIMSCFLKAQGSRLGTPSRM